MSDAAGQPPCGGQSGTAVRRRFAPFPAAERAGVYDPAPVAGTERAAGAGPGQAAAAGSGGDQTADGRHGRAVADAAGGRVAPRTAEATARLQRCATTPGSPLGAAMRQLADAADALAAVDVNDEHVDVAGDALVALHHLRTRLDATLLDLIDSHDQREGWAGDGAANACMWLRARTNTDYGAAATLTHAARRLRRLPRLRAHLAAGDVTLSHVTAVTKACVPQRAAAIADAQDILCDLAVTNPPGDVRRALRALADTVDPDGTDPKDDPGDRDPLRELTLRRGYGERGELLGTLDTLTREALTVLLDAFDTPDDPDTPADRRRSFAQRRHDAFAAMLHTLLAQPGLPTVQGARPHILVTIDLAALLGLPPDHPAADLTLTDLARLLDIDLSALGLAPDGEGADAEACDPEEAYPEEANAGPDGEPAADTDTDCDGDPAGDDSPAAPAAPPPQPPCPARPARFGSGATIDAAAVRGLLHAATILAVVTLGPWRAVNVGAKHRTLPAWLRGVLAAIHRRCRGPDCDRPTNWTQAHHITDWVTAHTTDLNDTLPLCPYHHDLITTKGWKATLDHTTGIVTWTSPDGRTVEAPPHQP